MAYKALYRTYRPSTFDEVAGQQHIVKTIKNALKTGKLAHAYLFTGPRGTGKTTMAKLLAKALNCEEGIGCQCNECKNCKAIMDGTHPDVLELDAASNNSVDDIRDLIDKVKYGTILGRYKVYIIDEVHMLSTGAFNALLKTLEEPPEHVIFVLATTEPHKILPTILSRCQRYDFTRVADLDIKERIRTVLAEEGIPFDEKAVNLIISLSDGGMRDALSILDQVLRYSGDKLNEKDIMDVFAIESTEEKIAFINSIINADSQDVLQRLNKYVAKGTDIKRLTDDLLEIFKDALIYKVSANQSYLNFLDDEQAYKMSSSMSEEQIMKMINELLEAQKNFKNVPSINSLFQVTVLKMTTFVNTRRPAPTPVVEEQPIVEEQEDEDLVEKILPKTPLNPTPIDDLLNDDEEEDQPLPEIEQPVFIAPEPMPAPTYEQEQAPVQNIAPEYEQASTSMQAPVEEKVEEPIPEPAHEEPVSLFETPVEAPVKPLYIKGTVKEGFFAIDDDLMLQIMVTAKKDIKNDLNTKWADFKKYTAHPNFGKAAAMLVDGHVLVASQQVIILEYGLKKAADRVNEFAMQKELQSVFKCVFDKQMFIYAVDRSDSVRLQQNYLNRMQIGKLPKLDTINIEIEVLD